MASLGGWTVRSLDPWGFVDVMRCKPSESVRAALSQADKEPSKGYRTFARLYELDDTDPLISFGLLYSARNAGMMIEGLERVAKRLALASQGRRASPEIQSKYLVPMIFGFAIAFGHDNPGSKTYGVADLRPTARFWYGAVMDGKIRGAELSRAQAALVGSSYLVLGNYAASRSVLRDYLVRNAEDARIHLLLCRAYSGGIARRTVGNPPKEVPIGNDERRQEALALSEAKIAMRLEPDWPEPRFYLGLYNMTIHPEEAAQHLKLYLARGQGISPERKAMIERFLKGRTSVPNGVQLAK